MKKMLIGVMDSNIGGINSYIIKFITSHSDIKFSILANGEINNAYIGIINNTVKIYIIPSISHPFMLYKNIYDVIANNNFDSLYLNISTALFYPAALAAKKLNKEVIVHSHSSYTADERFIKRMVINVLNKILSKKTNKNSSIKYSCSDKAAKWLFGTTKNVTYIYNSVSKKKFEFSNVEREKLRNKLNISNSFVVGFIGAFNYQKNNEWFIKFAKKINGKNIRILMIGEGVKFNSFYYKLRKFNLEKYFIILGSLVDAYKYYNVMDCFILPSRFEGLPFVGVEAQVNGLKCFFSNKITSQVLITEEAEMFNLKDIKKLITKISKLQIGVHTTTPKLEFDKFVF